MRLLLVLSSLALINCGPAGRDRPGGNGGADGNNSVGGDGNNGCSDAAKLIYVVDQNDDLSTFDGSSKSFHTLGALTCNASSGATPFSMGVDRNANAYVLYSSGELFKVDTTQASLPCTKTPWSTQLGLQQFGMGFSTDTAGGTTDTLYIAGGSTVMGTTSMLAKLDITTFHATQLGTVTGWPELTGTGNAELWGFFPDASAPRVEKLNKASGVAATTYPESSIAGTPSAWAFAFWGGDYWIFLMKDFELSTTVYQVDGTNGTIKSTTPASGRTIVGAGVSTCAPVVIL
ncbi:MAG: hypothetical protein JWO36_3662 [Myxococcales bacterium]|nr:hypothetical protein [Myxococcales bacterium]